MNSAPFKSALAKAGYSIGILPLSFGFRILPFGCANDETIVEDSQVPQGINCPSSPQIDIFLVARYDSSGPLLAAYYSFKKFHGNFEWPVEDIMNRERRKFGETEVEEKRIAYFAQFYYGIAYFVPVYMSLS